ncbi:MAG: hypothetical protein K0R67_12 [Paenibacillus sp.]|jgi:ribosomal protein S18 acetylase RimI-like enzyme|nr:hypothetical protein [Paenibacillus sp.]
MKVQFRPLDSDKDIQKACRLLRDSMPEREYNRTIFSCSGYPQYLRAAFWCRTHAATMLIGAYDGEHLIGFAEWRRLETQFVLNNLNVDAAYRSYGIGSRLIAYGEELALKEGVGTLTLDVFAWNEHAYEWYKRLGFVETNRTYWYERSLYSRGNSPVMDSVPPYIVEDFPMAEAHHAAYGFSSLRIRMQRGTIQVGRLGASYYRLQTQNGDWDWNGSLIAALTDLDPERRLLLLSPDAGLAQCDSGLVMISESVRMNKKLEERAVYYG